MDITTELDRNRATLMNARKNVRRTAAADCLFAVASGQSHFVRLHAQVGLVSGMTDQARRVLRSMTRREVKIKVGTGLRHLVNCRRRPIPLAPTTDAALVACLLPVVAQIFLAFFILLMLILIGIIIYFLFVKK